MSSPDAEVSDTSMQFQSKLILVQSDQESYIKYITSAIDIMDYNPWLLQCHI